MSNETQEQEVYFASRLQKFMANSPLSFHDLFNNEATEEINRHFEGKFEITAKSSNGLDVIGTFHSFGDMPALSDEHPILTERWLAQGLLPWHTSWPIVHLVTQDGETKLVPLDRCFAKKIKHTAKEVVPAKVPENSQKSTRSFCEKSSNSRRPRSKSPNKNKSRPTSSRLEQCRRYFYPTTRNDHNRRSRSPHLRPPTRRRSRTPRRHPERRPDRRLRSRSHSPARRRRQQYSVSPLRRGYGDRDNRDATPTKSKSSSLQNQPDESKDDENEKSDDESRDPEFPKESPKPDQSKESSPIPSPLNSSPSNSPPNFTQPLPNFFTDEVFPSYVISSNEQNQDLNIALKALNIDVSSSVIDLIKKKQIEAQKVEDKTEEQNIEESKLSHPHNPETEQHELPVSEEPTPNLTSPPQNQKSIEDPEPEPPIINTEVLNDPEVGNNAENQDQQTLANQQPAHQQTPPKSPIPSSSSNNEGLNNAEPSMTTRVLRSKRSATARLSPEPKKQQTQKKKKK